MAKKRTRRPADPGKLARGHASLALLAPYLFHKLGVGVSLADARDWHAVHVINDVLDFELEHGVEVERVTYNQRCIADAARRRSIVVGQLGGLNDLFVPVLDGREVRQTLVAGPFARAPATSSDLIDRWRTLTGRHGHLADAEFARYATALLSLVVFDDATLNAFKRLMAGLSELIAERGEPEAMTPELYGLAEQISEVTYVSRMWEAARTMVDPSTARTWASPHRVQQLAELYLQTVPQFALVALIASGKDEANSVDELVRRDAFQRACVELARALGGVACGQVGDQGVTFLSPAARSDTRTRGRLLEIGERASALARRFQLRLHLGTSSASDGPTLPARYQAALAAAEEALSRGTRIVHARAVTERPAHLLRGLRRKLGEPAARGPSSLAAEFERYLQVVVAHTGYRVHSIRLLLEEGFERAAEGYVASGALDQKSFDDLWRNLDQESESARTAREVFSAFRRAISDLEEALQHPTHAHRERSLRRALAFLRDHVGERLTLAQVAHVGGFAPNYFSRLFKQRERRTFEQYVRDLRVERAKEMLARTTLNVERVGQLSGFSAGPYFHRVFKQLVGKTPDDYRHGVIDKIQRPVVRSSHRERIRRERRIA